MEGWKDKKIKGRKDEWKDRQKDRQTLFYRTLLATAEGPKRKLVLKSQGF